MPSSLQLLLRTLACRNGYARFQIDSFALRFQLPSSLVLRSLTAHRRAVCPAVSLRRRRELVLERVNSSSRTSDDGRARTKGAWPTRRSRRFHCSSCASLPEGAAFDRDPIIGTQSRPDGYGRSRTEPESRGSAPPTRAALGVQPDQQQHGGRDQDRCRHGAPSLVPARLAPEHRTSTLPIQ